MRLPAAADKSLVVAGLGFVAGLVVAAVAFSLLAPAPARPTFVTHLLWRFNSPRIGIQVGHAETFNAPDELRTLRTAIGAFQDDWDEWLVNEDIGRRVAASLKRNGLTVDLLPTTVPPHYRADAFVALHSDAWDDKQFSGFKVTRGEWSTSTLRDDRLVADLVAEYAAGTGLLENRATISDNMREYYAFNYRKFEHSVDPSTAAAIIEMGFLTNDGDRKLLREQPDRVAEAIAAGIVRYLEGR